MQRLDELIPLLEAELGIATGFFDGLDSDEENDWSFIIKLHALVEAAVSHLLTERVQAPELSELFARLDMSYKATGKAAYVEALSLLDKPERRFMCLLSELRNKLVHDVRNITFDLEAHVEGMSKDQRKAFLQNFNLLATEVTDDVRRIFMHDPRQAMWCSGMAFLGVIYLGSRAPTRIPKSVL